MEMVVLLVAIVQINVEKGKETVTLMMTVLANSNVDKAMGLITIVILV